MDAFGRGDRCSIYLLERKRYETRTVQRPRASAPAPFERSDECATHRNGSRPRVLTTTAGELDLKIPKLRAGTFFPTLLERRRRIDQALFAVVMEAYLHGVSTRKIDDTSKGARR